MEYEGGWEDVVCKPARAYDRQEYDAANDGKTTLYGFSDGSM